MGYTIVTENLRIVFTIFLLLYFINMLKYSNIFKNIIYKVNKNFNTTFVVFFPIFIGLVPMPGGAYLSAYLIKNAMKKYKIKKLEIINFLNYWYRHVFVFTIPVYPSLIVAMEILNMKYLDVIKITFFLSVASILSGIIYAKNFINFNEIKFIRSYFMEFSPILILVLISILTNTITGIMSAIVYTILIFKLKKEHVLISLKNVNVKILLLIVLLIIYKNLIIYFNIGNYIYNILKEYDSYITFLLPFSFGLITGIEFATIMLSFPLIKNFLTDPINLYIAFLSSFIGVILSPFHLCLMLSSKIFNVSLLETYKYITISILFLLSFSILSLRILSMIYL